MLIATRRIAQRPVEVWRPHVAAPSASAQHPAARLRGSALAVSGKPNPNGFSSAPADIPLFRNLVNSEFVICIVSLSPC